MDTRVSLISRSVECFERHRQVNEFGVGTRLSYSDADCP